MISKTADKDVARLLLGQARETFGKLKLASLIRYGCITEEVRERGRKLARLERREIA